MNTAPPCYLCDSGHKAIIDPDSDSFGMCKRCAAKAAKRRAKDPRPKHTDTHRTCSKCRRVLPNDAFNWRTSGKYAGKAFSACKACNKFHYAAKRRAAKKAAASG